MDETEFNSSHMKCLTHAEHIKRLEELEHNKKEVLGSIKNIKTEVNETKENLKEVMDEVSNIKKILDKSKYIVFFVVAFFIRDITENALYTKILMKMIGLDVDLTELLPPTG